MADESVKVGLVKSLDQSAPQTGALKKKERGEAAAPSEFLELLAAQLRPQDLKSAAGGGKFAVDLKQFDQLEQLISGRENRPGRQEASASGLAGYLGQGVVIDTDTLVFAKDGGDKLRVNLARDVSGLTLELLGKDGRGVATASFGELAAGKHNLSLEGINASAGEYKFRLQARDRAGQEFSPAGRVVGTVTGFRPGAEPALLAAGREISPDKVKEVVEL
jgi:flagellar hook assembly protein FlgD